MPECVWIRQEDGAESLTEQLSLLLSGIYPTLCRDLGDRDGREAPKATPQPSPPHYTKGPTPSMDLLLLLLAIVVSIALSLGLGAGLLSLLLRLIQTHSS